MGEMSADLFYLEERCIDFNIDLDDVLDYAEVWDVPKEHRANHLYMCLYETALSKHNIDIDNDKINIHVNCMCSSLHIGEIQVANEADLIAAINENPDILIK